MAKERKSEIISTINTLDDVIRKKKTESEALKKLLKSLKAAEEDKLLK